MFAVDLWRYSIILFTGYLFFILSKIFVFRFLFFVLFVCLFVCVKLH